MLLEVIIEIKESFVLTLLNKRRNADINKGLIFRSLSLKPANYRLFQNDVTVSFLKFYVIRNVLYVQPQLTHSPNCLSHFTGCVYVFVVTVCRLQC